VTTAGSISGEIRISAKQALAQYAALRASNAATKTALLGASAAFARVGVAAVAAALPIVLLFKKAVTAAADFQKKIDYFGAVTGASEKDMQAVADKAIEMGKTTVYSASQMADAFVEFGKAGISTQDILNGVADATANLAQAAGISVADASNIMASQLATFQLGAKGAAHVADVLAGAANASIIDVSDLAYSLKYAGGIASTTGISFDELVTAISLLGQRGIRGSTAGTSLRQIMISLLGSTKAATIQLKELGIITDDGANKFVNAQGHLKSLSEVFQILQTAEKGYTEAEQLRINKTIFNTRALSAVQILMRDGAKGFGEMQTQINKVTASDVAHKRLDNLAGDWTRLKNTINTVLIQVGGPLQNMFRKIVQGLLGMVRWFANLSPTMQKVIIYGLGIFGAFLLILGTLSLMIALVLKTIAVYRDLRAAFILVRAVTIAMSEGFLSAAAALLTNPVFLVIAAIAALVIVLIYCWKHFQGFRDFIKGAWADIKGFFLSAWDVLNKVLGYIVDAAKATADGFMHYFVHPIVSAVKAVVDAFQSVYKAISGAIMSIIGFVKEHWKAIIAILLPGLGLIIDAVVTHWDFIKTQTEVAWNAVVTFLKTIWNGVLAVARAIWDAIVIFFKVQLNAIKLIFTTTWNAISSALRAVWNTISGPLKATWNGIRAFFEMIWRGISNIFQAAVDFMDKLLQSAWNVIGGPLTAFWNGIAKFFTLLWTAISKGFRAAWNGISSFLNSIWRNIGVPLKNAATAIWNGIQAIISKVYNTLKRIATNLFNAFDDLYKDMLTVGKNIAIGIWNGISSLATWLWNKVKHFVSHIWNNIMGFFGIHSPSTKGIFLGEMLVRGINKGVDNQKRNAVKSVQNLSKAMLAAHTASLNTRVSVEQAGLFAQANAQTRAALMNAATYGGKGNAGFNVENLNVNNPTPETASDSLPRAIRKVNYITAGPTR
jgi:TP901 family phage tail tape measure protein